MFYVLHGTEEFRRSEEIARFKQEIAKDGMGDLNIITLDGRRLEVQELINVCSAVPFLTDRRLIITEGFLERFEPARPSGKSSDQSLTKDHDEQRLSAFLAKMPPTTRLVFLENKTLSRRNPILMLAKSEQNGYVKAFEPLQATQLEAWLSQRAREKGVTIEREAARLLAESVSNDLRRLDREIEKLAGYADYQRSITVQDVQNLVSADLQHDIFALVDALGSRKPRLAMHHLQTAQGTRANELYVLSMIARQVRLILAAKDLAEVQKRSPQEVQSALHISHGFIVKKLLSQAQQFTLDELQSLQRHILQTDQSIKTGRIKAPLALELLVLDICQRRKKNDTHQGKRRSRTCSAKASSRSSPAPRSR